MLTFAAAVFLLIITPGPGVLSTAGVGAAYGYRPGVAYVTGLFVGNNLVALAVVSGIAAIVLGVPILRLILLTVSVAYLLYLAFRIATAGARIAFIEARSSPGFVAGFLLQPINPKAYAVSTTLFSGFAFYPDSLAVETILKFVIMNAVWVPIHLLWLHAGCTLHRLNIGPTWQFRINLMMAAAMLGVVALALWSAFARG